MLQKKIKTLTYVVFTIVSSQLSDAIFDWVGFLERKNFVIEYRAPGIRKYVFNGRKLPITLKCDWTSSICSGKKKIVE